MAIPISSKIKQDILDSVRNEGLRVADAAARYAVGVSTIYTWLNADTGDVRRKLCAVANVVPERRYGPGGFGAKKGTKLFVANAKVYVIDYFWGMGAENVTVIGHHRKSHKLITTVMKSEHLENWRIGALYSPAILDKVSEQQWNGIYDSPEALQHIVDQFNARDTENGLPKSRS